MKPLTRQTVRRNAAATICVSKLPVLLPSKPKFFLFTPRRPAGRNAILRGSLQEAQGLG
jgi:hypothetical protein